MLEDKVRPPATRTMSGTRLVCLENTHNRGGGRFSPLEKIQAISRLGAGDTASPSTWTGPGSGTRSSRPASGSRRGPDEFDTVSVCFSKGLGAPVGSALVGPRDLIDEARRIRKLFGGGHAAGRRPRRGGLYALDHHVDRLAEDHPNARLIAAPWPKCRGCADAAGSRDQPRLVRGQPTVYFRSGSGRTAEG